MTPFIPPDFQNGALELRCEEDGVLIYGTPKGLIALADLCRKLAESDDSTPTEHVHLEDYELLDKASLAGTIAVFRKSPP